MGRPSTFTQDIADRICERIADGQTLRKICADEDMPGRSTVWRWLDDPQHTAFRDQYVRAREVMLDDKAEELEEIGNQAARAKTAAKVAGLRLKSDNRKWLLSKLAHKKYGEKIEIEQRTTLTDLTEEQIDARIAKLYGSGGQA